MRSFTLISILATLGYALPQDGCSTTTTQVIVPTKTATYTSNVVMTEHPSTAKNLGTFTQVTTISQTTTVQTVTSALETCYYTDVVSIPIATETVYTSATPHPFSKRDLGLFPRDGCTVTVTQTTTYGQTHVWIPGSSTSTYMDYTAYTQATVTSTKSDGKAYAVATSVETRTTPCGSVTVTPTLFTTTVTLDPRCSPSAMTSAYNNYGIEWLSDVPAAGAVYYANTTDASQCCQLCAETDKCATSAWDIRYGNCRLEFPVDYNSGSLNCGQGLLGYYNAGPNSPMSPGAGWYVAQLCGNAQFGAAKPDDGS